MTNANSHEKNSCNSNIHISIDSSNKDGESLNNQEPVREIISKTLPATLELGITALLIALIIGLAVGFFARVSALGLLSTMIFAVYFHLIDTGLEGFPFAVVENHNYNFELSAIYAAISFYFACAGPGRLSAFRKTNTITYYPKSEG